MIQEKQSSIQDLYLSYSINNEKYNELLDFISNTDNISDVSVLKEIDIIRSKLHDEVIKILRK
jgi:hypothetical protein